MVVLGGWVGPHLKVLGCIELVLALLDISLDIFVLTIKVVDSINPNSVFIGLLVARIPRFLLFLYSLTNTLVGLLLLRERILSSA